jgi:hypothetical protein
MAKKGDENTSTVQCHASSCELATTNVMETQSKSIKKADIWVQKGF